MKQLPLVPECDLVEVGLPDVSSRMLGQRHAQALAWEYGSDVYLDV